MDSLSLEAGFLVGILTDAGQLTTKIRETATGDVEWLSESRNCVLPPGDVLGFLHELEQAGLVERTENVHPYDSSEYDVIWQLSVKSPGCMSAITQVGKEGRKRA